MSPKTATAVIVTIQQADIVQALQDTRASASGQRKRQAGCA